MKSKSICFLLPCISYGPSGGFKVIFEYANYLVSQGYQVSVIYPGLYIPKNFGIIYNLKRLLLYFFYRTIKDYKQKWFTLDKRIKEILVPILSLKNVGKYDYYVASSVGTAIHLESFNIPQKSKIYFIQGYENWYVSDDTLKSTYKFGFKNVVISDWLANEVRKSGANCTVLKNGFDFEYFKLSNIIENRNKLSIAMLYSKEATKGCIYGIDALKIVKQKYPDIKVTLFGYPNRSKDIPYWIDYYQAPDKETHNRIYNESSIFLAPSVQEGWGLTVGEAMICGAAVVCTDTKGFLEMVTDKESGIVVPIKNSKALADAIILLIENNDLRINIAKMGASKILEYSWNNSFEKFVELID